MIENPKADLAVQLLSFFLFQIWVPVLNQKLVEMFILKTCAVLVLFCLDKENVL